jgi:hypothetical protein
VAFRFYGSRCNLWRSARISWSLPPITSVCCVNPSMEAEKWAIVASEDGLAYGRASGRLTPGISERERGIRW